MTASHTVFFVGGGTGGHLYPGLAIAQALTQAATDAPPRCVFLCSDRAIDRGILSARQAEFHAMHAKPISPRPRALWAFLRSWGKTIRQARSLYRQELDAQRKVVVVAMGGFVAAPCVRAALAERLPVIMVNLDAVPGKANRWIAPRSKLVFTAAKVSEPRWQHIRPIVRAEALPPDSPQACRRMLGLDPDRNVLLVTGGSQGARSLNDFVTKFATQHAAALSDWQILHQTGKGETQAAIDAYASAGVRADAREFLDPMGPAWGAADLAVCRAGAGTVAEVWATRTPALFLPYPYHHDNHQRANAQPLVDAGGAMCLDDAIQPAENLKTAGPALLDLLGSAQRRTSLRDALTKLGPVDGARSVALAVLDFLR